MTSPPYAILFVCTGNICRSPTAEAVLRHRLAHTPLPYPVHVDSAGTSAYHAGEPPDPRTIRHAFTRGYDLSPLRARALTLQDYTDFDLILALDATHLRHLTQRRPASARAETALFLEYAGHPTHRDVPDPYYGGTAHFETVLDMVETGVNGLIARLAQRNASR